MLVRSILQQKGDDVVTIDARSTIGQAAAILVDRRIGALVVADDEGLHGILSERDIVRGLAGHGPAVLDAPVDTLMTAAVRTCGLDDTADTLMATMTEQRIRHLPVLERGALVGIVSIGDVVKHRVEELQVEAQTLQEYLHTGR